MKQYMKSVAIEKEKIPKTIYSENFIKNAKFEFFGKNRYENIHQGIKTWGPYDKGVRITSKIKIYIIKDKPNFKINTKDLKETLLQLFKIECELIEINDQQEAKIVNEVSKHKENTDQNTAHIVLHVHGNVDNSYNSRYYRLKKEFLNKGIPTQGVLFKNIKEQNSFKKAFMNNLACDIYVKTGGRPWVISENISNELRGSTLYIGFDVSRGKFKKTDIPSAGAVVVYDEKGQEILHLVSPIEKVQYEHMSRESAESFIRSIITRIYHKINAYPENIVYMRDGDIDKEEQSGLENGLKNINKDINRKINLHIIEVKKRGDLRIFDYSKETKTADAGTCIFIKDTDEFARTTFNIFLQTIDGDVNLENQPNAIKISIKNQINISLEDVARQIINLCHLNWSSLRGISKLPVVVHYAHKASEFHSAGIDEKYLNENELWMI